jgi:peptidoglycan/LPS O-acetylase OafA/YrhL
MDANTGYRPAGQMRDAQAGVRPGNGKFRSNDYLPQLDGIRALAIFAVLVSHFLPEDSAIGRVAQWGRLGVILFFTLSGFLITGILLRYRDFSAAAMVSPLSGLRVFYIRRFLRIFPIYYLTVVVIALGGYEYVRKPILWHMTYTSNISLAFFGRLYGYSVHLWSLCVEEQFYLLWPCLVMFTAKRTLPKIALAIIVGSVLYKAVGSLAGLNWVATNFVLFGCLDSLALGALYAIHRHKNPNSKGDTGWLSRMGLFLGVPSLIVLQWFRASSSAAASSTLYVASVDLATALAFLPLLQNAACRSTNLVGKALSWTPIRYVGKISYGIYLYHYFLVPVCQLAMHRLGWEISPQGYPMLFICTPLCIALASLSWYVVEGPINGLKRHFQFGDARAASAHQETPAAPAKAA